MATLKPMIYETASTEEALYAMEDFMSLDWKKCDLCFSSYSSLKLNDFQNTRLLNSNSSSWSNLYVCTISRNVDFLIVTSSLSMEEMLKGTSCVSVG